MGEAGASAYLGTVIDGLANLAGWLDINPTLQDFVKAGMLIAFVLIILMILGDVYRGEIQNKLHRIHLLSRHRDLPPLRNPQRSKDIALQVQSKVIPIPLDGTHSDLILHVRFRDHLGRLRTKKLHTYRVKFAVRLRALHNAVPDPYSHEHNYRDEEKERLPTEEDATMVSLASSRVDYVNALVENDMARMRSKFEKLRNSKVRRLLAGTKIDTLTEPAYVGLLAKFHFPIDPYFLLYKHPDTNVRSTAWLTVMTSVFALFMQLVYVSHGPMKGTSEDRTSSASISEPERPIVPAIKPGGAVVTPTSLTLKDTNEETIRLRP